MGNDSLNLLRLVFRSPGRHRVPPGSCARLALVVASFGRPLLAAVLFFPDLGLVAERDVTIRIVRAGARASDCPVRGCRSFC